MVATARIVARSPPQTMISLLYVHYTRVCPNRHLDRFSRSARLTAVTNTQTDDGGVMVRALHSRLKSKRRGFNTRPFRYQVTTLTLGKLFILVCLCHCHRARGVLHAAMLARTVLNCLGQLQRPGTVGVAIGKISIDTTHRAVPRR